MKIKIKTKTKTSSNICFKEVQMFNVRPREANDKTLTVFACQDQTNGESLHLICC